MSVLSDQNRLRRTVAGLSLIAFPLAGFVSCFTDSSEGIGEKGSDLYATVSAHQHRIWVTGLLFIVSSVLAAPAAFGLAHVLSRRGVVLGHLGAACLLIGSFGHMGYAVWQMTVSRAAGAADTATMTAYLDRTNDLALVLIPMMVLIDIGVLLLSAGLLRARAVPGWAPWLAIAAMVADFGVQFGGVSATWPVTAVWGASLVAFGFVGVCVLRMPTATWAAFVTGAAAPAEPAQVAVPA
jgi:hypothetical protein